MEVVAALDYAKKHKPYYIVVAISTFCDLNDSMISLCFTLEEAREKLDQMLPIDIEIQTMQRRNYEVCGGIRDRRSRQQIIQEGVFKNPLGDPKYHEKECNGYPVLYKILRVNAVDIFTFGGVNIDELNKRRFDSNDYT